MRAALVLSALLIGLPAVAHAQTYSCASDAAGAAERQLINLVNPCWRD